MSHNADSKPVSLVLLSLQQNTIIRQNITNTTQQNTIEIEWTNIGLDNRTLVVVVVVVASLSTFRKF